MKLTVLSLFIVIFGLIAYSGDSFWQSTGATAEVTLEDGTTVPVEVVVEEVEPFPGVSMEMALAIVTFLTPIVVWVFRWSATKLRKILPSFLLPILASGIGLLLTYLVAIQADTSLAWYMYTLIALAVIGLREWVDRFITKPVMKVKTKLQSGS